MGVLQTGHRRRGAGLTTEQIPDLERAIILSRHKGRTVYVDSAVTVTTGNGDSWAGAYATLALALAAAFPDDMILVAAGHAESIAASLPCTKARVTVLGLGQGASRPAFTFTAAASTITVSAAGCSFVNLHFIANFVNVVTAFTTTTAKDLRIDSCTFVDTSLILNFLSCVTTAATANAADGLTFVNNTIFSLPTTDAAVISVLGALDRLYVCDNFADKAATNDAGHFITIAALVIRAAQIRRNTLYVVGSAGAAVGIFMTGSSTTNSGIVAENFVVSLDTTAALLLTATLNLGLFENYYPDALATSGAIWPVATGP